MLVESLIKECELKAVKASGSGGQHVNKVSTKIELQFNVQDSILLTEDQKGRLLSVLKSRLTNQGILILQCSDTRSQVQNKERVIKRFKELILKSLEVPKKRKPTKTPKSIIKKRLDNKKRNAEKKTNRKKPDLD